MRTLGLVVLALPTCSGPRTTWPTSPPATQAATEEREPRGGARNAQKASLEPLTADTPEATSFGHTFIAPAGWSVSVRGHATIVTAPEGTSHIAFVDVQATDATEAVAAAWAEYGRTKLPPLGLVEVRANENGWTDIHAFEYQVPPNEQRLLFAEARRVNDDWLVVLGDASNAAAQKRGTEFLVMLDRLYPKGHTPESFAGNTANRLDEARVAELAEFVEMARTKMGVPGISLGLIQDGKIVFFGGFGANCARIACLHHTQRTTHASEISVDFHPAACACIGGSHRFESLEGTRMIPGPSSPAGARASLMHPHRRVRR